MNNRTLISLIILLFVVFPLILTSQTQDSKETRLKSISLWKYEVISGNIQSEGTKISSSNFNEYGKVIEQISYNADGTVLNSTITKYNAEGNPIELVTTSSIKELDKRIVVNYNESKYPSESIILDLNGKNLLRSEYLYDENNLLVEIISKSDDNKIFFKVVNNYNEDRTPNKTMMLDKAGNIIGKRNYSYGPDGYKVEIMGKDIEVMPFKTESFDKKGNREEEVTYNAEGKMVAKTKNIYDKGGNILEKIIETPSANMRTRTKYIYDKDLLVEQINYNKLDEPVEVIRIIREYYD